MKTLLWLDDARDPNENGWAQMFSPIPEPYTVVWVKNYQEFVNWIIANGLPDGICFDHDLGLDEVYEKKTMSKGELRRFRKTPKYKTGYDCAKWLTEYCLITLQQLPKYASQSANPVGMENILKLLNNFKYHQDFYSDDSQEN